MRSWLTKIDIRAVDFGRGMKYQNVLPRFSKPMWRVEHRRLNANTGKIFAGGLLICIVGSALIVAGTMGAALPLMIIGGILVAFAVVSVPVTMMRENVQTLPVYATRSVF